MDDERVLKLLEEIVTGQGDLLKALETGNQETLGAIQELGTQIKAGTQLLGSLVTAQLSNHETRLQKLEAQVGKKRD